jgi:hypothetical protein
MPTRRLLGGGYDLHGSVVSGTARLSYDVRQTQGSRFSMPTSMKAPARLTRPLPAIAAGAVFDAASALTRGARALQPEAGLLASGDIARGFAYGLVFDLVGAAYAVTPFLLSLALAPGPLGRTRAYCPGRDGVVLRRIFRDAAARRRGVAVRGRVRRTVQFPWTRSSATSGSPIRISSCTARWRVPIKLRRSDCFLRYSI